jgi:hypothetical protein
MKLSPNEQAVLAFLSEPKLATEVAHHLGHKMPPYGILRLLQRLDLVERVAPARKNTPSTFVATGKPMKFDPDWMQYKGNTVMGVRL